MTPSSETPGQSNVSTSASAANVPADSPQVAARREREKRTISQMIAIYCAGNHKGEGAGTCKGYCGEPICSECAELDDYAIARTERCRSMAVKTSCEECGKHCYSKAMRERIRTVMRYAGPRMITKHPIAAIRHLLKK